MSRANTLSPVLSTQFFANLFTFLCDADKHKVRGPLEIALPKRKPVI
jgi:hypothetical protein